MGTLWKTLDISTEANSVHQKPAPNPGVCKDMHVQKIFVEALF